MTLEEVKKISSRISKKDATELMKEIRLYEANNYKLVGKYLIHKYNKPPKKINMKGFVDPVRVFKNNGRPAISYNGKTTYLNKVVYEAWKKSKLYDWSAIKHIDGNIENCEAENLEAITWGKIKEPGGIVW